MKKIRDEAKLLFLSQKYCTQMKRKSIEMFPPPYITSFTKVMVANAKGSLGRFQRDPKSIDIIRHNVNKCMHKMNQWASVRLSNEEERLQICKGSTVYGL